MRVIAGSARRLALKTIEGPDTRPTTDRIKETLFNMLQQDVPGCAFLDLFSGSGGIGIEALSRGAKQAVLIEKNPLAAACIRSNLEFTGLSDRAMVMNCDVLTGLSRLENKGTLFDLIFMDPPYGKSLELDVLRYLAGSKLAGEHTVMIVETDLHTPTDDLKGMGLSLVKAKVYKTNRHLFITKEKGSA